MQVEHLGHPTGEVTSAFHELQSRRRAIRDFSDRPLDAGLLETIVASAGLAPSSMGLQPYELHVVAEPELRTSLARACNGQRAARSAQALAVFVVGTDIVRRRIEESRAHYLAAPIPQKSRDYHLAGLARLSRALHPLLLPLLGAARVALSIVLPSRAFLPLGPQGVRDWAARNAMLAAQNLLLAAAARGVDSCPMEGFDGPAVARVLGLPRGAAPSLVLSLGYRADDAHLEPGWRRRPAELIVNHPRRSVG